jgi:hypothetical protein
MHNVLSLLPSITLHLAMADENAPLLVVDEQQKVDSGVDATQSRSKASDGLLVGMLSCIGFLNVRIFLPAAVVCTPRLTLK